MNYFTNVSNGLQLRANSYYLTNRKSSQIPKLANLWKAQNLQQRITVNQNFLTCKLTIRTPFIFTRLMESFLMLKEPFNLRSLLNKDIIHTMGGIAWQFLPVFTSISFFRSRYNWWTLIIFTTGPCEFLKNSNKELIFVLFSFYCL